MRSRLNRIAGMLLILGTIYAAQSCDRHTPTEIAPRGLLPTSPLFDLSPPPLGTYNIPVPAENNFSNNGGSAPWAYTGIRIPGYTAYVITVNGRVSTTKNPAWYCQGTNSWPYDGHNYGPLGTGANYDLLVQLRVWPFSGANSYVPVSLPGVGSDSAPTEVKTDTIFTWYDEDLEAKRNGIAFACDNVGGYLMSGSQTLTVEEITNTFRLTPSEYYVHPGTRVSFTASMADGSPLSTTISWGWIADSLHARTVSNICGQNVNPCSVTPTVSGTVRVAGFVLGKGHEAKGHVTVYTNFTLDADRIVVDGGDTVTFTPKVDGQPAVAARWRWVPQDTSYHDATPCVAGKQCQQQMLESGTMWAYLSATPGSGDSASKSISVVPKMKVKCAPATVLRGESVECSASVIPAQLFTVTQRQASGPNFSMMSEPNTSVARGQDYKWGGTAVAATTVIVAARTADGTWLSASGMFAVNPRPWQLWQLTTAPDSLVGVRDKMPKSLIGAGTKVTLANYRLRDFDPSQIPAARVLSGPDSGLSYVVSQPPLRGADIYFHPDLLPGTAFYRRQDGIPSGTCDQSDMPTLWNEIRRHEGRTQAMNSHYGKTNEAFGADQPQLQIEQLVSQMFDPSHPTSAAFVAGDAAQVFYDWNHGAHHARQQAFDNVDYPLIEQVICILDTSR